MAHSKRNSTRAFFTAHERSELKGHWGSTSTRLTRESFLSFGSCNLCLNQVEDPVACPGEGHLFCRECAISNLLTQTKDIKRLQKEAKRRDAEIVEQAELEAARVQNRELVSFEKIQAGLETGKQPLKRGGDDNTGHISKRHKSDDTSFWIPSQSGEAGVEPVKIKKLHPVCPMKTTKAHDFTLKALITVNFSRASSKEAAIVCPSCDKSLTNMTKGVLAKACGHVICKACSDRFQNATDHEESAINCYVCQTKISVEDGNVTGLILLKSDATGFAGAGNNTVKKDGLAFQFG